MIKASVKDFFEKDIFVPREEAGKDTVSNNTKVVLYGLFSLVGFAVLMYAITTVSPNFNKYTDNATSINDRLNNIINSTTLNATEKSLQIVSVAEQSQQLQQDRVQELEQIEQLNSVYIAVISGSLALGGTLIAQLWGRSK